jgi:hypothetical protein
LESWSSRIELAEVFRSTKKQAQKVQGEVTPYVHPQTEHGAHGGRAERQLPQQTSTLSCPGVARANATRTKRIVKKKKSVDMVRKTVQNNWEKGWRGDMIDFVTFVAVV